MYQSARVDKLGLVAAHDAEWLAAGVDAAVAAADESDTGSGGGGGVVVVVVDGLELGASDS
jgi:hypothetical protein